MCPSWKTTMKMQRKPVCCSGNLLFSKPYLFCTKGQSGVLPTPGTARRGQAAGAAGRRDAGPQCVPRGWQQEAPSRGTRAGGAPAET